MSIMVRDTKAGRSIAAYVVLKEGKEIATVQFHYGDSGTVRVDVWLPFSLEFQGKAGGYGYDKASAAISGCKIEGYEIVDSGKGWDRQLEQNGFSVIKAI